MGTEQNKTGFDRINKNHDEKQNITEKEWALLEKYRNLCEENKLTIGYFDSTIIDTSERQGIG